MQQLSRTDTFLRSFDGAGQSVNSASDIGKDVPRFSLIEVSALVTGGKMKLSFAYNKHMEHQDSLAKWAKECGSLLREAPRRLMQHTPEKTLGEFQLLPLAYYGLENLGHRLRDVGVDLQDVEDVYPCSPMQRGLLLSRMRDPDKYAYRAIFQVECSRGEEIDPKRLCDAWQAVVRRHATLRTVFVDTVGDEGLMDQVVLRSAPGRTQMLHCGDDDGDGEGEEGPLGALQKLQAIDYNEKKPPHRLAVCATSTNGNGRVFCQLEISHAICDGSSLPILLGDLADAYGGDNSSSATTVAAGNVVPLYRDYMTYIQSQPRSDSVGYWKDYLGGAEPCLFPPLTDGEEVDAEPSSLGSHAVSLGLGMVEINDYCADADITPSTLLQFVWALVVRSYTGSDEVLFGYLASGRDVPVAHMEHAVGAFINMLVCRLRIADDTEVGEALDTMRADLADAMAHQSCSLAEMQHELGLPGAALFNTAFTYQKRTDPDRGRRGQRSPRSAALQYRVVSAEDPSEYAVAVNVEAADETVEVHFSYWRNVVSDAQIRNVAATFEQVLSDLVADGGRDDRTVGEVDLVGGAGIRQICAWNDYKLPRVEQCVHHVISQHALQRPLSTPAVCGWDASFTYRELDGAAAALARYLVTVGAVGPEVFVPLCFEKSAWTVVAQVAVLKAGGAFVNLDPGHPDSRLAQHIRDVGAKVVLCSAKHKAKMDKITSMAFVVAAESIEALSNALAPEAKAEAEAEAAVFASSAAKPSNAAYIIFTSGTTGKPKGTVIEHGSFCTGAMAHAKAMFMRPDSRVLQFASYTFDASIMETLSCLLVGGCVCVPSDEDRINDVAAAIRNMGVTWTLLTPSVASTVKPESVPCLRTLVTGGEPMAAGHIARWGTRCALINAYGPTECSVVATTSTKVDESHRVCNGDRSNMGTAVGGRVWVVDARSPDRLVPVGAVGELVVEGRLVARGYLNEEDQTARAFIRSPEWTRHPGFAKSTCLRQDSGSSMYRTGDLVRYNSDGSVSYVARKDMQIKLNGRRIELGEIEVHCRGGLPDDAQAAVEVVVPPNNRAATKSLCVFFSLPPPSPSPSSNGLTTATATPTPTATTSFSLLPMSDPLRNLAHAMETHLSGLLPAYMVPQLFVPVSAMPWTSAGKLDRRQLRRAIEEEASQEAVAPYRLSAAAAAAAKRRAPASEMEKRLQGLWEAVLGLPAGSVGAGDSFFRVGGDSLTAMRLVGAARARRIVLSVLDIFEKPVLADMARACGGLEVTVLPAEELKPFDLVPCSPSELDALVHEVSAQCLLFPEQIRDMYPCSPLQEGLVALANKQAGAYVAVNTLKLPEHVDLDRFKAAWQEVVDETDTLRTRIVHTAASGFLQTVVAPEPIDWHDEPLVEEAVAKGKTLGSQNGGRLTRYAIVQGQQQQGRNNNDGRHFVWAIHHALYDGWSLPLIARRVQDVYNTKRNNNIWGPQKNNNNPGPRPSYANFIHYLGRRDMAASEKFWTDSMSGASSVTHFPQPPPAVANHKETTPRFRAETRNVKVGRNDILVDITVPTLIRAAWAIVLAAYTGMDHVVFGETLAGRNVDVGGVMEMTGPTFTTVPTRVRLCRDMRLTEFLRNMHGMASRVVPHQHLGLQHIKRLNPDCSGACDFQNLLTINTSSSSSSPSFFRQQEEQQQQQQNQHVQEADWNFQGGSSAESFFTHPLVLECNVTDAAIEATFHYDEKVLSTWHTKRLVHQLEAVLKLLADRSASKEATLADIHVISPEDQALIARWNRSNNGPGEVVVDSCIHHLFLEQASAQSDRVGISAWDAELKYGEIRDHASRLALRLSQLGVGRGTLVPVCLARSAWSVVTLLGILMAGGAFVPLDPAHPLARQKEMLETIAPSLVICSPEHASRFADVVGTRLSVDGATIRNLPPPPASSSSSLLTRESSPTDPNPSASSNNTAYVLFTSGSTGRPKGVVVAHRDFCSSSRAFARATHMDASSRVFHFASLTFDAALMEVLTPLTLGACVCVPAGHERLHDLGGAMARLRATWAFLTPSVANLLDPAAVCPGLKTLVCGGEAMVAQTVARWANRVELMNGYGPTEACVLAVVNQRVSAERDPAVIGRATAAAHTWVVELPRDDHADHAADHDHDWLAPVGAVGELAISGPLLARGYLQDPDKTARAFVENPAWATKGCPAAGSGGAALPPPSRIYRTGDLVRYRPDGALEFVGRRDGQVKVNGQRIELGEIESWLSADRRVRLALVVQPKMGPCKRQLVGIVTLESSSSSPVVSEGAGAGVGAGAAFISPGDGGDCNPVVDGPPERLAQARAEVAEIRSRLADLLPQHMVPAAWIVLTSMPVVVSGKLDRQRVARWVEGLADATYERIASGLGLSGEGDEEEEEEVQVTGPTKTLREIWARELHLPVDRIKFNQAFLSLGKMAPVFGAGLTLFFLVLFLLFSFFLFWAVVSDHIKLTWTHTGGDSIRAMGVVSRARNARLIVSIQDVLRSKSVVHLAQLAKLSPSSTATDAHGEEETEEPFALAPIQSMYLKSAVKHHGEARFNQSFALGVPRRVTVDAIKRAMDSIVQRHSMLRARFARKQDGNWEQRIAKVI